MQLLTMAEDPSVRTRGRSFQVPYVLVGAGTASHFAMKAILQEDPSAKIVIIGDEKHRPYVRTPLSKEAWKASPTTTENDFLFQTWNGESRSLFHEDSSFYQSFEDITSGSKTGAALLLGCTVIEIDPVLKRIILDSGDAIFYDKCLIATGGHPRNLPVLDAAPDTVKSNVILFRTIADFHTLQSSVKGAGSIAVVGGGFLGSELAVALAHAGRNSGLVVHQIFPEKGNLATVLPDYLSDWTSKQMEALGVTVHSSSQINQVDGSQNGPAVVLTLDNGTQVTADKVVVAVGLEPNTALAISGRLETDPINQGFVVNSELQARNSVWVAGDACSFYDISLGRRRSEHYDSAVVTGQLAGLNMTGAGKPFFHQPIIWSDLGPKIGFEAIGLIDASLETVAVWAKPSVPDSNNSNNSAEEYQKGVLFYMRDKQVVGMLLWNIFDGLPVARKIIRSEKAFESVSDLARYFSLFDD